MHANVYAVVFALASALTLAWGTAVRHRIAEEAPADGTLRGSPFLSVLARPLWWAGTGTAMLGYGLQVVALGFGSLLLVQPILVLSLMFTLPLSARYEGRRPTFEEMGWAGVLTFSVGILVILGNPLPGEPQPPLERWLPWVLGGVALFALLDLLAHRTIRGEKALLLGIVTGGVFGYVSVLSKAVVDIFIHEGGFLALLANWETYALVATAIFGTAVQQSSFHAGALKTSLPAMKVFEPIVAFTLGYAVLGEKFQVDGLEWLWMGLAVVAMFISTFALSRRGVGTPPVAERPRVQLRPPGEPIS